MFIEPYYGVVTTVRPDGSPHSTVVWLDYDGENVVFNTAEGRAKPRHIRRTRTSPSLSSTRATGTAGSPSRAARR